MASTGGSTCSLGKEHTTGCVQVVVKGRTEEGIGAIFVSNWLSVVQKIMRRLR